MKPIARSTFLWWDMSDWTDKNILAIETSTRNLKLGLHYNGDRLVKSEEDVERSHGAVIIKKINELFGSAGQEKSNLEALVVSTGPGSFTGLRIGLAIAKGMAVALDLPIVGVSLFELACYRYRDRKGTVHVMVPFKQDALFMGAVENGQCDPGKVEVVTETNAFDITTGKDLVGIGFESAEKFLAPGQEQRVDFIRFDAADMLYVGIEKLNAGDQV